jgi:ribonuclease VapC
VIVDASALLAVLFEEPDAAEFAAAIGRAKRRTMSVVNYAEAGIRADGVKNKRRGPAFDRLYETLAIELAAVTSEDARAARQAYFRFGKGHHPARLNFGDCFAYALAKARREPLLFKGEDFAKTDIEAVV